MDHYNKATVFSSIDHSGRYVKSGKLCNGIWRDSVTHCLNE